MKDIKDLFAPYEIAVMAKEKGFDERCLGYKNSERFLYNYEYDWFTNDKQKLTDFIAAPLYQQIVDWFRDKHKIHLAVYPIKNKWDGDIRIITGNVNSSPYSFSGCSSYYEAFNKAIEEAFKLI